MSPKYIAAIASRLRGRHFEIALLRLGALAKERDHLRDGDDQDQEDDEVHVLQGEPDHDREARQPQPRRERGGDAPAIELAERREIEEIQEIARVAEADEQRRIEVEAEGVAGERAEGAEDGSADADGSFHPRIARRFLERDERAHEGNENRRARP